MTKKIKRIVSLLLAATLSMGIMAISSYAAPQPKSDPDLCFVNTDGGNLNGREKPGVQYKIICKYANGTQLGWSVMPSENAYDDQGRSWMRVSGKTTTGTRKTSWVLEEYLRFESPYSLRTAPAINSGAPDVG